MALSLPYRTVFLTLATASRQVLEDLRQRSQRRIFHVGIVKLLPKISQTNYTVDRPLSTVTELSSFEFISLQLLHPKNA